MPMDVEVLMQVFPFGPRWATSVGVGIQSLFGMQHFSQTPHCFASSAKCPSLSVLFDIFPAGFQKSFAGLLTRVTLPEREGDHNPSEALPGTNNFAVIWQGSVSWSLAGIQGHPF